MAKISFDLDAAKAAFAAKGGKVETVAIGVRAIESDRTIWKAIQNGTRVAGDAVETARASEAKFHRQQDAYASAKYDGWNESDAQDYAQHAV